MTKQEQFLFIVQTTVLANGINLATDPDMDRKVTRDAYSATGVLGIMDDAVYASERIPTTMTAFEAAHEFCYFSIRNLREVEEIMSGKKKKCPIWYVRS